MNMNAKSLRIVLLLLTISLSLLIGWSIFSTGGVKSNVITALTPNGTKDMILDGVYLIEKKNNNKSLEIKALTATVSANHSITNLSSFSIISFGNNQNSVTIFADTGLIDKNNNEMTANGNILVKDMKGRTLITDHLRWFERKNEIRTDSIVRLFSDRFIVYGNGMLLNLTTGQLKVLNNVKAVFR